jgi:predicted CXXCH cytochrome family protein
MIFHEFRMVVTTSGHTIGIPQAIMTILLYSAVIFPAPNTYWKYHVIGRGHMMNRRTMVLIAGIAALGALLVMISLYTQTLAEDQGEGTRSPADYVGIDACKGCHSSQYAEWQTTKHGIDFATNWTYGGNLTNKYTLYGGSCLSCHVVGYNETAIGGYDPAQAWNSSYNTPLLGIQCESCHGPGSDHPGSPMDPAGTINLLKDPYAESCGGSPEQGCHGGGGQFGNDTVHGWNASAHAPWDNRAQTEPGGLNTYCASCKSPSQHDPSSTYGTADPIAKDDWRGITCGDCHDAHSETSHEYQLKWSPEEICGTCHTSGGGTYIWGWNITWVASSCTEGIERSDHRI